MAHDFEDPYKEKHLTPEQWEREAYRLWQSAESPEEVKERLEGEHIVRLVAVHFLVLLSRRQQQVVRLYCLDGLTQVEIAEKLGITQQTVQQHLMGKLRNGRLVGGAFRRLRKAIHKEAVAREGRRDPRTRSAFVVNRHLIFHLWVRKSCDQFISRKTTAGATPTIRFAG
ncbi:hypothetical protein PDESU_03209 [Pontiella desulfatans]|uniref:HTH cro/C1-type domain-containing protein n=1 Tax=Pontiella desulfatans TaxID=2750659 RepID=A0A6C2U562_PONDE|nr:sigma-70 family RNA polymerase sigma factor [Pontiella desulfatans]VGO14644.1 hypothetical protein PDESU_03209 [Pontiella desulfatans]